MDVWPISLDHIGLRWSPPLSYACWIEQVVSVIKNEYRHSQWCGMVMKSGKVLCFMFSFAIMGVEPSKFKTWLCVLIQLADRTIVIM